MARIRFTKKGLVLVILLFLLVAGGVTGFILWRINQQDSLSSGDSNAGELCSGTTAEQACADHDGISGWEARYCAGDCSKGNVKCNDQTVVENVSSEGCEYGCDASSGVCNSGGGGGGVCQAPCQFVQGPGNQGGTRMEIYYCEGGFTCSNAADSGVCAQRCDDGAVHIAQTNDVNAGECYDSNGLEMPCGCYARQVDWFDGGTFKGYTLYPATMAGADCVNKCETGFFEAPLTGATFKTGDSVTITGWASDKDGIDTSKIDIKIDGVIVGQATTQNACPTLRPDVCAAVGNNPAVVWTFTWVATAGSHTIGAEWKDSKGATGQGCQGSSTITVTDPPVATNPPLCKSMTVTGGQVVDGSIFVNESEQLSVKVVGKDPDAAPKRIDICYTIDGQTNAFYQTSTNWVCSNSTTLTPESDGYSYTFSGLTFASMRQQLATKGVVGDPNTSGFVFSTNILDDSNSNFCSTNVGYNNGAGTLFPGGTQTCDGDSCVKHLKRLLNPNWIMDKNASVVCMDDTSGKKARVNYTITVKNIGSTEGALSRLEDTLDSKVTAGMIVSGSIAPTSTFSGGKIVWDLTGVTLQPNETKTFTYSVDVPAYNYGQYTNTAVLTPASGSSVTANKTVMAACNTPITGIFDSVIVKVLAAFSLVFLAIGYLYFDGTDRFLLKSYSVFGGFIGSLKDSMTPRGKISKSRKKFEKRVTSN